MIVVLQCSDKKQILIAEVRQTINENNNGDIPESYVATGGNSSSSGRRGSDRGGDDSISVGGAVLVIPSDMEEEMRHAGNFIFLYLLLFYSILSYL